MTQTLTSIPTAKPLPDSPRLRITRNDDPCHRPPSAAVGAPPASPPQPGSPLERFLSLYLDESLTLADIAFTLSLSITETLARTTDPEFLKLLEAYSVAQDKRAEVLARCNKATAARTFARLAEYCDKPETARKAASDIIRMQAKEKTALVTPDMRIRAVHAYAKHPTSHVLELLSPILAPPQPPPRKPTSD